MIILSSCTSLSLEKENKLNKGGFFKYYSLEQYEDILKKAEYKDNIATSPLLGLKGIKIKDNEFDVSTYDL